MEDFFSHYLSYTSNIEPPAVFHRWCAIAGIGAFLGRQYYLKHGNKKIYPNMYCKLIGSAGTRKSTAIKEIKQIMQEAGYNTISAEKSTKEKFLLDLAGEDNELPTRVDDILDQNLFGSGTDSGCSEMFIAADEFNNFIGNGNIEFLSLLGELWDFNGVYRNRIKNGKSVNIPNPTISILGGNTPTGLNLAFPVDIIGQGFFSRTLFIYGEKTRPKITWPVETPATHLITYLQSIRGTVHGEARISDEVKGLIDRIYKLETRNDDTRFDTYYNRRLTHLFKLCLIVSAARCSTEITARDVIYANTILSHTEQFMPRALGEFGKGKSSDVAHKILEVIYSAARVITLKEIFTQVSTDVDKLIQVQEILNNLTIADKIQIVQGDRPGYIPKRKMIGKAEEGLVDYGLLTDEERGMKR